MNEVRSFLAAEIVAAGQRLASAGLIAATEGNLSARLTERRILATPAGREKGRLSVADLVEVNIDTGAVCAGPDRASSEIRMHLVAYRHRPDVQAVVHAHPLHATSFAAARRSLDSRLLAESVVVLGPVPLVPYGTPSTDELPDALFPFLADHDAFLLANHGALTLGRSVAEAYFRMETLERLAQITLWAELAGGGRPLGAAELSRLLPVRERYLASDGAPPLSGGHRMSSTGAGSGHSESSNSA